MSRASNTLKASDISTTPIKLKYSSSYDYEDFQNYGIGVNYGINREISDSGSIYQPIVNYKGVKQLYYQNYITGSVLKSTGSWDSNQQSTAYSGSSNFEDRYFPIENDSKINSIAIPPILFGESIAKGTFVLEVNGNCFLTSASIVDDSNGNLVDKFVPVYSLIESIEITSGKFRGGSVDSLEISNIYQNNFSIGDIISIFGSVSNDIQYAEIVNIITGTGNKIRIAVNTDLFTETISDTITVNKYNYTGTYLHVGNIIYSQGMAIITNQDYQKYFPVAPTVVDQHYIFYSTESVRIINLLAGSDPGSNPLDLGSINIYGPDTVYFTNNYDGTVTMHNDPQMGNYTFTYSISNVTDGGCLNESNYGTIYVDLLCQPIPVTFGVLNPQYYIDDEGPRLTGSEAPSGSYTGNGLSNINSGSADFDPLSAGLGTHVITYFVNNCGCISSNSQNTNVICTNHPISFTGLSSSYHINTDTPATLIGSVAPSGSFSGPGVTDNNDGTAIFDMTILTPGTYDVAYEHRYLYCTYSYTASTTLDYYCAPLTLTFTTLSSSYEDDDPLMSITSSIAPLGTFSGPGIVDYADGTATFDPTIGEGTYTINLNYVNGVCSYSASQTTQVLHPIEEFRINANYVKSFKFSELSSSADFSIIWDSNRPNTQVNYIAGNYSNIQYNYDPNYYPTNYNTFRGDIIIQTRRLVNITGIVINEGDITTNTGRGGTQLIPTSQIRVGAVPESSKRNKSNYIYYIKGSELTKLTGLKRLTIDDSYMYIGLLDDIDTIQLPRTLEILECQWTNLTGNISNLPQNENGNNGLTILRLNYLTTLNGSLVGFNSNTNTYYGTLPQNLTKLILNTESEIVDTNGFDYNGNQITGNIEYIPNQCTTFIVNGINTLSGNLANVKHLANIVHFQVLGNNTIYADINAMETQPQLTGNPALSGWTSLQTFVLGGPDPSLQGDTSVLIGNWGTQFAADPGGVFAGIPGFKTRPLKIWRQINGFSALQGQVGILPETLQVFEHNGSVDAIPISLDGVIVDGGIPNGATHVTYTLQNGSPWAGNLITGPIGKFSASGSIQKISVHGQNRIYGPMAYSSNVSSTYSGFGFNALSCSYISLGGDSTITGGIYDAPPNVQWLELTGLTTPSITVGRNNAQARAIRTWKSPMFRFNINPKTMSSGTVTTRSTIGPTGFNRNQPVLAHSDAFTYGPRTTINGITVISEAEKLLIDLYQPNDIGLDIIYKVDWKDLDIVYPGGVLPYRDSERFRGIYYSRSNLAIPVISDPGSYTLGPLSTTESNIKTQLESNANLGSPTNRRLTVLIDP